MLGSVAVVAKYLELRRCRCHWRRNKWRCYRHQHPAMYLPQSQYRQIRRTRHLPAYSIIYYPEENVLNYRLKKKRSHASCSSGPVCTLIIAVVIKRGHMPHLLGEIADRAGVGTSLWRRGGCLLHFLRRIFGITTSVCGDWRAHRSAAVLPLTYMPCKVLVHLPFGSRGMLVPRCRFPSARTRNIFVFEGRSTGG